MATRISRKEIIELVEKKGYTRYQNAYTYENESIETYLIGCGIPTEIAKAQVTRVFKHPDLKGLKRGNVERDLFIFEEDLPVQKVEEPEIPAEYAEEPKILGVVEGITEAIEEEVETAEVEVVGELAPWDM